MLLYICPSYFLCFGVIACSISNDDAFVSVYLSQVKYLMGSLTLIGLQYIFPVFESTLTLHIHFPYLHCTKFGSFIRAGDKSALIFYALHALPCFGGLKC